MSDLANNLANNCTHETTISEALTLGKAHLVRYGMAKEKAHREARYLLAAVLRQEAAMLLAYDETRLSERDAQRYRQGIMERTQERPLAHIGGVREFYGYEFACKTSLIPRPDSETLIELALRHAPQVSHAAAAEEEPLRILDLGCGSGCLGIAFALSYARSCGRTVHVGLADTDEQALECARTNAERYLSPQNFTLYRSNWFAEIDDSFDLILCNPPYVCGDDWVYLPRSVRWYEPWRAHWGGDSGLLFYELLAASAAEYLRTEGLLIVEIGAAQSRAVSSLFAACGWELLEILSDLGGIERSLALRSRP